MTRVSVYSATLAVFVAATAMTIVSILTPHWVSYSVTAPTGATFFQHIGLHEACDSINHPHAECRPYPLKADCDGGERAFCSMWRTTGFLMSFATVAELATVVGFVLIATGGKYRRETGWRILGALLLIVAVTQLSGMSIVAYLLDHDDKFRVPGYRLDFSWILCTVSAGLAVLCAAGLATSAFVLPPEDGYEFLEDPITA